LSIQKPYVYALLLDNQYAKFKLNESNGLPDVFYQSLKFKDSLKLTTGAFVNIIHFEYFASKRDTVKAIKSS
jgi:hypothetical protein